jgi:hypothetical protein
MIQIGMASRFHSDLPLANRLDGAVKLAPAAGPVLWTQDVCVFRLPEHLRRRWWDSSAQEILEQSAERLGFAAFVKAFREFAAYKCMPLAADAKFGVLIRASGQTSSAAEIPCFAIVNLGDENTHIVVAGERVLLEPGDGCWSAQADLFAAAEVSADLDVLLRIQAGPVAVIPS